jgi:3-methyladenine DNA glycosylase AlkD
MDYNDVMSKLRKMGTAQNRKVYARHMRLASGEDANMFGVSYANLGKLKKEIRTNHDLALELWNSGNHDARVLATMIADPEKLDNETAEAWIKDCGNYVITDAVCGAISASPMARRKMEKWTKSKQEWIGRAGWWLLAGVAAKHEDLPDSYFEEYLEKIESDIHTSKNRVRDAMNTALINIGLRSAALEKKVKAAAKRIGTVEVDHGETSCKTPDAIEYIDKVKAYRAKNEGKST